MPIATANGKKFTFPDGTTPEQMGSAIDEYFASQGGSQPAQQSQPMQQAAQAAPQDGLQSASDALRGFRDIPQAGSQMLLHSIGSDRVARGNEMIGRVNKIPVIGPITEALGIVPDQAGGYDKQIQQEEQDYQSRRAAEGESGMDLSRIGGNIVATAPIAALGGGPVAQGAVIGAMQPVTDGGDNFGTQKAIQTGIGAATGYIAPKFVQWAAKAVKGVTDPAIQKLAAAGVKLTPGQLFSKAGTEAKLTSTPIIGGKVDDAARESIRSFNQAAYKEALAPIGAEAPSEVGHAGLQTVRKTLSNAYDDVLSKAKFIPDEQFGAELASLKEIAKGLAPKERARFLRVVAETESKQSPIGGMAGETYKIVESKLLKEAKNFNGSTDPYQRELGGAVSELLDTYKRALSRSNPEYAKRLSNINEGWANYARLRKAASSVGAEDGIFSAEQLLNAVKAEDKTVGKRAFSEGTAAMQELAAAGKKVLKRYPDSWTAGREAVWNPIAWAGGALLSPIYAGAKSVAPNLLLSRPEIAQPISNAMLNFAPYAGRIAAPAAASAVNPLINGR